MNKKTLSLALISLLVLLSCEHGYMPKPRAYFRITLPEHNYKQLIDDKAPYTFDYPSYSEVEFYQSDSSWINLRFPQFNAKLHITYHNLAGNLNTYIEDSRTLAYKHTIKADAINEKEFDSPDHHVFGTLYDIRGDAASSVNFFLTDSTQHFLRGALYFNCRPNKDSLAPVVNFLKEDIYRLMESCRWKAIPPTK